MISVTVNSIASYHQAVASGLISHNQQRVLNVVAVTQPSRTAAEIALHLKLERCNVRPRLRELELMRVIAKGITRVCSVTGRPAATYHMTGNLPIKLAYDLKLCPTCHGKGKIDI